MDIHVITITEEQAKNIVSIEEGHFSDVKSIDISPSKLTRSISAFANASGGELHIGIDEKESDSKKIRHWRGFADPEAGNAHIQTFEKLFPLAIPSPKMK